MYGEQISDASRALVGAMADFYGPGTAPALRAMIGKVWEAEAAAAERMQDLIAETDARRAAREEVEKAFSTRRKSFGLRSTS